MSEVLCYSVGFIELFIILWSTVLLLKLNLWDNGLSNIIIYNSVIKTG